MLGSIGRRESQTSDLAPGTSPNEFGACYGKPAFSRLPRLTRFSAFLVSDSEFIPSLPVQRTFEKPWLLAQIIVSPG